MSELLTAVVILISAGLIVALVAIYRRVPFKAGVRTGDHEITFELNSGKDEKIAITHPSSTPQ